MVTDDMWQNLVTPNSKTQPLSSVQTRPVGRDQVLELDRPRFLPEASLFPIHIMGIITYLLD